MNVISSRHPTHPLQHGQSHAHGAAQIRCDVTRQLFESAPCRDFRLIGVPNPQRGCNSDRAHNSTTPSLRAAGFEDEDEAVSSLQG
jgi:hypothetical protein